MIKATLHFLWACFAAALCAMTVLTLTMPLFLIATTGGATGEGLWPTIFGTIAMLPFVIVIGGMVALPIAAVLGGMVLWLEWKLAARFAPHVWIIVGLAAGVIVSIFVGTNEPLGGRLLTALWFASCSATGAFIFARISHRRETRAPNLPKSSAISAP